MRWGARQEFLNTGPSTLAATGGVLLPLPLPTLLVLFTRRMIHQRLPRK
jgi:hypothetical protein